MANMNMFLKYRQYFERWLNIPAENMEQSQGVFISSSEKRKLKPDGWLLYLPVCAYETKNALFISCIPEWMPKEFKAMVDKKIHYCVFVDNEIVSATDSEDIPNKPNGLIQIGINTLQEHRRNGYASFVCAAFIKNHLEQGVLPIWYCDVNNKESAMLAMKLGLCHVGNEVFVSTLVEV